jgi:hypothetical protein
MVGAFRSGQPVLRQRQTDRLHALLQGRFVVRSKRLRAAGVDPFLQLTAQKRGCGLETTVQIDRRNQRFVRVGEQRLLEAVRQSSPRRGRESGGPRAEWPRPGEPATAWTPRPP